MPRRHLLEIHEQPWCPAAVRDAATGVLAVIANVGRQYDGVLPLLDDALHATGATQIVDLGSGGGGPWLRLTGQLNERRRASGVPPVDVRLTDLFPSDAVARRQATRSLPPNLSLEPTPVGATAVPVHVTGFRTLFTAFHHFRPAAARAILQDAVNRNEGIAIVEQTEHSLRGVLTVLLLAPIAPVAIWLVRPLRPLYLLWTFVLPVLPFVLAFDGLVSCLRTYSEPELRELVERLNADNYAWQIGRVQSPLSPMGVSYLIGYPSEDVANEAR